MLSKTKHRSLLPLTQGTPWSSWATQGSHSGSRTQPSLPFLSSARLCLAAFHTDSRSELTQCGWNSTWLPLPLLRHWCCVSYKLHPCRDLFRMCSRESAHLTLSRSSLSSNKAECLHCSWAWSLTRTPESLHTTQSCGRFKRRRSTWSPVPGSRIGRITWVTCWLLRRGPSLSRLLLLSRSEEPSPLLWLTYLHRFPHSQGPHFGNISQGSWRSRHSRSKTECLQDWRDESGNASLCLGSWATD